MKRLLSFTSLLLSLLLSLEAQAATLIWEAQTSGGALTIERGESPTGPFALVATVPQGTTQYILTPGAWGHYRVTNSAGSSNTAQYTASLYTGFLQDRVDALEVEVGQLTIRVTSLEQAPQLDGPASAPVSNFTVRDLDADHVEIVGTNCASMATTGSGTRRVIECRH